PMRRRRSTSCGGPRSELGLLADRGHDPYLCGHDGRLRAAGQGCAGAGLCRLHGRERRPDGGLEVKLRDYQRIARGHMTDLPRCALWAKPGMGKTAAALHAAADLILAGGSRNVLVIAPVRVARDVWTDEVEKWPEIKPVVGTV